jgi:hypothetical protein
MEAPENSRRGLYQLITTRETFLDCTHFPSMVVGTYYPYYYYYSKVITDAGRCTNGPLSVSSPHWWSG